MLQTGTGAVLTTHGVDVLVTACQEALGHLRVGCISNRRGAQVKMSRAIALITSALQDCGFSADLPK